MSYPLHFLCTGILQPNRNTEPVKKQYKQYKQYQPSPPPRATEPKAFDVVTNCIPETMSSPLAISLIGLPYQFGRRSAPTDYQMARGPEVLLDPAAVPAGVAKINNDVKLVWLDDLDDPENMPPGALRPTPPGDQMIRQLHQNNALADAVRAARKEGRFPLCFSGGCNSSLGVISGIDDPDLGMFWFDAHADDNTPETSTNGMFEGMPVSVIAGECWKTWREKLRGFHVIPAQRISQIGLHDYTNYVNRDRRDGVGHLVDPKAVKKWGFETALLRARDEVATRAERVYIHIDTDIIDKNIMQANTHCREGGLSPEQVVWAIGRIAESVTIEAINFTSFDVAVDPQAPGILTSLAVELVKIIDKQRTK